MVIAIDGPAGAGKSSVTRLLAERIGFQFLDTGAMYRAVTWAAIEKGCLEDDEALLALAKVITIQLQDDRVLVDNQDVSKLIRTPEVTRNVVRVADNFRIRERLVQLQREIASTGNFVSEGRDQGTVAFPDAVCKIYLTASAPARARRRVEQMQNRGDYVDFDQVMADQALRDEQDRTRKVGALKQADDAIVVNTDEKDIEAVVNELAELVASKVDSQNPVEFSN